MIGTLILLGRMMTNFRTSLVVDHIVLVTQKECATRLQLLPVWLLS